MSRFAKMGEVTVGGDKLVGSVTNSTEFQRIVRLPRRELSLDQVPDCTPLFAKSGVHSLLPVQSAALVEAARADGLFAQIHVGGGKTLIALLLAEALDSRRTLLLIRTELRRQLDREIRDFYGKHFHLPMDRVTVATYDDLSSKRKQDLLEREEYDAIVADEGHCLANPSVRGKRFKRYMDEHAPRLALLSGTVTTRSLVKYAPLLEYALRKNSPLPRGYREVRDWAGAIDVEPEYFMRPGVLHQLCRPCEDVREGYRRRLAETRGVVLTEGDELGTSLIIRKVTTRVASEVKAARKAFRKDWEFGEGRDRVEVSQATELVEVLKQMAAGFYYVWDWPDGEPDTVWLESRRLWNADVRRALKHPPRARDGTLMDSYGLLLEGAERGEWVPGSWPGDWGWSAQRHKPKPPNRAVWISDYLVADAVKRGRAHARKAPTILWAHHTPLGRRVAEVAGVPYYGEGTDAGEDRSSDLVVCSASSQIIGKNLQHQFSRNVILELQPNGLWFEQLAGRTHRRGQGADEVWIDWYGHVPELTGAMDQVFKDAEYQQTTLGARQKVLYADHA